MSDHSKYDRPVVTAVLISVISISFFLYHEISARQLTVFLLGTGLGITLMHAGFGFTGGWRTFILTKESRLIRAQIILFILCSIVMFPLVAHAFSATAAAAALAPVAFSVLFGSFLFGIGMQLGGGCGSGSLYTVGQGQIDMLITILFFIIGSFIASLHLEWWTSFTNFGSFSLIAFLGWKQALVGQLVILLLLYAAFYTADRRRNGAVQRLHFSTGKQTFIKTLIFGHWPVLWGSLIIAILAIATLLVTGHTWSITFAFGLWGAKLWQALGGAPELTSYWSSGYPARALGSSVLYDVTSVMNFGIILGAALAAALANKYSPPMKLHKKRVLTAILGGLLLGYGARLAFGCNIGALFAGISTGSAHAWVWLVGGIFGNLLGVYIRKGLGFDKRTVT
jgi:uncharacterized membrane protein YedE/YeeE